MSKSKPVREKKITVTMEQLALFANATNKLACRNCLDTFNSLEPAKAKEVIETMIKTQEITNQALLMVIKPQDVDRLDPYFDKVTKFLRTGYSDIIFSTSEYPSIEEAIEDFCNNTTVAEGIH